MLTIKVNSAQVQAMLDKVAERAKNMTPLMRQIAATMKDSVEENFATEGVSIGTPWKKSQRAIKQGGKTLQDTGRLAASISAKSTNTEAIVGTNVEYAAIHQFGGSIKQGARSNLYTQNRRKRNTKKGRRGQFAKGTTGGKGYTYGERNIKIPARPFLGITDSGMETIKKLTGEYLIEG